MFFNEATLLIQQIFTNIFQALFLRVHTQAHTHTHTHTHTHPYQVVISSRKKSKTGQGL